MVKHFHLKLDIKGCLLNWDRERMERVFTDYLGRELSDWDARNYLLDELANGHRVLPVGGPCDGFDYSGGGCPGHDTDD